MSAWLPSRPFSCRFFRNISPFCCRLGSPTPTNLQHFGIVDMKFSTAHSCDDLSKSQWHSCAVSLILGDRIDADGGFKPSVAPSWPPVTEPHCVLMISSSLFTLLKHQHGLPCCCTLLLSFLRLLLLLILILLLPLLPYVRCTGSSHPSAPPLTPAASAHPFPSVADPLPQVSPLSLLNKHCHCYSGDRCSASKVIYYDEPRHLI